MRKPANTVACPTSEPPVATGAVAATRPVLGLSLPLALGLLAFAIGLTAARARLDDPDVMLHVVTGRWIIAHHAVPHVDFLSHTMAGTPWVAHEWLGEVIAAWCYDALGWHGLVAMATLGLAAAVAIFTRALLRYYRPVHVIIIACAAWVAVTPHWLARPHILALPLMVLWVALLVAARERNRAPRLVAALIMIPWANLHGTFLVGIGFTGLFAVEAILLAADQRERIAAARHWSLFTLAALAATMVTPNGIEAYMLPLRLLDMKFALSVLLEWKSANFQSLSGFALWILLFLGVALWRGIKLPPTRMLMTLLLFEMSLQHARNADLLTFIVPLIIAPAAGAQLAGSPRLRDWLDRLAEPATARGLFLAGIIAVGAVALAASVPLTPGGRYMPVAAVRAALAGGLTGPVLNEYDYGDYLLFSGIKTFIDGRADMYGDPFMKRYYDATRALSPDLPALLDEYHATWTIFPYDAPAVLLLDRLPGWHRFYQDDQTVIHARDGTPAAN